MAQDIFLKEAVVRFVLGKKESYRSQNCLWLSGHNSAELEQETGDLAVVEFRLTDLCTGHNLVQSR